MSELLTEFISQVQNLTTELSALNDAELAALQNILINKQFYQ